MAGDDRADMVSAGELAPSAYLPVLSSAYGAAVSTKIDEQVEDKNAIKPVSAARPRPANPKPAGTNARPANPRPANPRPANPKPVTTMASASGVKPAATQAVSRPAVVSHPPSPPSPVSEKVAFTTYIDKPVLPISAVPTKKRRFSAPKWLTSEVRQGLIFAAAIGAIILAAILIGFFTYQAQLNSTTRKHALSSGYGIFLSGTTQNTDIAKLQVTIIWTAYWIPSIMGYPVNMPPVDFALYSVDVGPRTPVLNFSSSLFESSSISQQSFVDTFSITGLDPDRSDFINPATPRGSKPNSVSYPFDTYFSSKFYYALDAQNNPLPIYDMLLQDVSQGFTAAVTDENVNIVDAINQNITGARLFKMEVSRASAIKAFVIFIALVMWALTLICIFVTISAIVFNRRLPPSYLVIPTTILFALPQIRGTMPGVPASFGTYLDLATLLVCEILVAACFVCMNIGNIVRSPMTAASGPNAQRTMAAGGNTMAGVGKGFDIGGKAAAPPSAPSGGNATHRVEATGQQQQQQQQHATHNADLERGFGAQGFDSTHHDRDMSGLQYAHGGALDHSGDQHGHSDHHSVLDADGAHGGEDAGDDDFADAHDDDYDFGDHH